MLLDSLLIATLFAAAANAAPTTACPPTVTLDSGVVIGGLRETLNCLGTTRAQEQDSNMDTL